MGRATIRVLALASLVFACLAIGAAGAARPAAADDGQGQGSAPTTIPVPPFVQIAAGDQHACGLTEDGAVWCWWYGAQGQLGDGKTEGAYAAPVRVVDLPPAKAIAAGGNSTCAIDRDGGLWCWGKNDYGQVGDGTSEDRWRPVRVVGLDRDVVGVSISDERACATLQDATARCWGDNGDGQLGDGTRQSSSTPVRVTVVEAPIEAVSVGEWHACALAKDGSVWCWGSNWRGALGVGDTERHDGAVEVVGLGGRTIAIAAGYWQTCALRQDGAVFCWGENSGGHLGVGATEEIVDGPRRVSGLPAAITDIGTSGWASSQHSGAVAGDGSVWAWGDNDNAEVGPGAAVPVQDEPIQVMAGGTKGLAIGGDITAVLLDSSEVRWWGDGDPNPRIPWSGQIEIQVPSTGYRPTGPLVPAITTNIPTPADISTDPPVVGANLLLAAIAMIAFTIAIELLNRTLADAEPFLRRRVGPLGRLDRARARADALLSRRLGHGRPADALRVLGIAAFYGLVFALLDPSWDPLSITGLWLVLSFAVACGLVGMSDDLASWATARRWGVASELGVRPGSLLAALASTVATRALVLVPGVMIGTPEALEVDEEHLDRPRRGRLAAMGLGAVGLVGALAWLVTLGAGPLRSAVPGIAVLVGGIEALLLLVFAVAVQNGFVQLLAFRNSAGRALFHLNKIAWGVALLAVTFVFWHTLVNPRGDLAEALGATNVQAFLATVGVVLAVAAAAWLVAFTARRRAGTETASTAVAVAEAPAVLVAEPMSGAAEPATVPAEPAIPAEPAPPPEPTPVATESPSPAPAMPAESTLSPEPTVPALTPEPARVAEAAAPAAALLPAPRPTEVVAMSEPAPVSVAPTSVVPAPVAPGPPAGDGRVPCPRCAEPILPAARLCRFCGLDLGAFGAVAGVGAAATGSAGVGTAAAAASYRPTAPSVAVAPAAPATPAIPLAAPAQVRPPAGPGLEYSLHVPGNGRLGGPARLTVAPERLELDAGWVDLAADRVTTVVIALIIAALAVPAVPILAAAGEGRFHPERVQWLRELMILAPVAGIISIVLLRRWRDRRRLSERTSCPVLAAEARATVDSATALLATALGGLFGGVAWLFHGTPAIQVAVGLGGAMVALGVYLAVAGRTMVVIRAPLDPGRSQSVLVSLKARDRDAAAEIVAAIREAQRQAGSPEVPAR